MKKTITVLLLLLFLVTAGSEAKTAEEKAALKAEKNEQKEIKRMAKAARIENTATVLQWANEGDVQAECILAYAYSTGQRVKKNTAEAIKWHNKATEHNPSLANNFIPFEYRDEKPDLPMLMGLMAIYSHDGKYVSQSFTDSVRWAALGAKESDLRSLAYIGSAYYTGRGLPQDFKKALQYLKRAEEYPLALELLSDAYAKGNGVEADGYKSKFFADYAKIVENPKIYKKEIGLYRKNRKLIESR